MQKLVVVQRSRHFDKCFVGLALSKVVNVLHLEGDKVEGRASS